LQILNSQSYITTVGAGKGLHADFGSGLWDGGPIGIPYAAVNGLQPKVGIVFDYADESDPGPYPVPLDAQIEGGPLSAETGTFWSSIRAIAFYMSFIQPIPSPMAHGRRGRELFSP